MRPACADKILKRGKDAAVSFRRMYPVFWAAAFLISAVGTYVLVRSLLEEPAENPTRDRIRALIDEADQLLKTLDEQRRG